MLQLCRAVGGSGIQWSEVNSGVTPGLVSGVESRGFQGSKWQRSGCQEVLKSSRWVLGFKARLW